MDFNSITPYDTLVEKWSPILEHNELTSIDDMHKKRVTAVLLENQKNACESQYLSETAPVNSMGGGFSVTNSNGSTTQGALAGYDPILISLVRRAMPNVVAYDICGVQPMTAPTGLIFAMRSRYDSQSGYESHFDEPWAQFSGDSGTTGGGATHLVNPVGGSAGDGTNWPSRGNWPTNASATNPQGGDPLGAFRGMLTATGEDLGNSPNSFAQMAFSIERIAVEAKTRALKAEYTTELAQDLKAVHGLDAESELANILSTEILNEINREIIRSMYKIAKTGCLQSDLAGYNLLWGYFRHRFVKQSRYRYLNAFRRKYFFCRHHGE